jgi:poly-gamma-glutamate capsule biosynthesis protein CapA/YwtB (metallophosphatase superfamily)
MPFVPPLRTPRIVVWAAVAALAVSAGCRATHETAETVAPAPAPASAPPRERRPDVTVLAVGDLNLGRALGKRILSGRKNVTFAKVRDEVSRADIAFANLESQISDQKGVTEGSSNYVFTAPPAAADEIANAGFDVVSTANNHAWDFGERAMRETMDNMRRVGVATAGTGETIDEAYTAAVVERKGWRVAFLAVTGVFNSPFETSPARDHVAWADPVLVALKIKELRAAGVDVVIVSYHGGVEYQPQPTDETRRFARACLDAGADAFVGHHPHVAQGVEWYAGKPIFYSLGNFVFKQFDPWTDRALAVRMTFHDGGGVGVEYVPVAVDYQPRFLSADEGAPLLSRLAGLSGGALPPAAPAS